MWLLQPGFCLNVSTVLLKATVICTVCYVLKGSCLIQALCSLSTPRTISFFLYPPPPTSVLLSSHVFPIRYRRFPCHSAKNCEYRKIWCSGSHTLFKNANEYDHIICIFHPILETSVQNVFRNNIFCADFVVISAVNIVLFVMLWTKFGSDRQHFCNGFKWNYSYYMAF